MISRRRFMQISATGLVGATSLPALAGITAPKARSLAFYNLHTGEELKRTYWTEGQYLPEALREVNYVLRDHRTDELTDMDPELLDFLFALQTKVSRPGAFHVISGYRSPKTNDMLRRNSGGVAKRSLHMQGRAIDIRLPGTELKHLRKAALALHRGGVGYYPKSNFIHVDTGRPRFW